MERKAVKFAVVGLLWVLQACADGEERGAGESTSGPDLGSGGSSTGPGEPPATSASATAASTTITTADPSESSSSMSGSDSGDESGSDSDTPVELGCDAYCGLYMDACQDYSEYANAQHCLDHCAQWPVGAPQDTAADSLGCRTYHVTVASTTDPNLHCPHSGPSGEETCVDAEAPTCDLYCTRYFTNCTDDNNLWESMDACVGQCGLWYPGTIEDTTGHSIGCRAYWANLAKANPEVNCNNAGPGGGEQCVLTP